MSKTNKQKSYRRGVVAEYIAGFYLMLKGYRILKFRYKSKVGEIDIIAKKGPTIIACEVKAHNRISDSLYAITPRAQKRITRALQYFLAEHSKYQNHDLRFDVIAVNFGKTLPNKILHLDNAWMPGA